MKHPDPDHLKLPVRFVHDGQETFAVAHGYDLPEVGLGGVTLQV